MNSVDLFVDETARRDQLRLLHGSQRVEVWRQHARTVLHGTDLDARVYSFHTLWLLGGNGLDRELASTLWGALVDVPWGAPTHEVVDVALRTPLVSARIAERGRLRAWGEPERDGDLVDAEGRVWSLSAEQKDVPKSGWYLLPIGEAPRGGVSWSHVRGGYNGPAQRRVRFSFVVNGFALTLVEPHISSGDSFMRAIRAMWRTRMEPSTGT